MACFHPATLPNNVLDRKLQSLIDDASESLEAETRGQIMEHIASARFSTDERTLEAWSRVGPDYSGRPHPSRPRELLTRETLLNSAEWHTVKHTGRNAWQEGTTTEEYLDDLRAAVRHECAILDVGQATVPYPGTRQSRSAPRAGVRTDLKKARPVLKRVTCTADYTMLTVYAVDTRKLTTAFPLEATKANGTVCAWVNHRAFLP
jgi:hypothetical protein